MLEDSQTKLKAHDSKFRQINAKKFTLTELMSSLEANRNRYEYEDLKGPKGFLRKGFRKLGENAQSFGQWLQLVPNSQYSTPIVGSFMIFLSMADRMHKVREDIFETMTAVPADFNDLRDYLSVYRNVSDEDLSIKAASVCTNIFRTLQHAMRFMGENPFKKAFKALRLEKYEEVVSTCIINLQESKQQFRGAVDKHLHSRVGSLFKLAKSSSMLQRMMICEVLSYKNTTIDAIESSHRDIKAELESLRNAVSNAMYNKLLSDQDEREYLAEMAARKVLELQNQEMTSHKNGINISEQGFQRGVVLYDWAILRPVRVRFCVRSYDREEERASLNVRYGSRTRYVRTEHVTVTVHFVRTVVRPVGSPVSEIEIPGFDENRAQLDILSCLSQGAALSDLDISHLAWIKHNLVMRNWVFERKSVAVHIDGNIDIGPATYTSVTSFLCAETAHLFDAIQKTFVLSYFCGLFAAPTSKDRADARGMMANLLGQILQHKDDEVLQEVTIDNSLHVGIKSLDFDTLCLAFKALMLQLPKSWTVICLIDSIDFYETRKRRDKTLETIRWLLRLAKSLKKHDGATFKLLVTASKMSIAVRKEFHSENRIICPEVPVDNSVLPPGVITNDVFR
ncbi:uncharacterized protein BDR25DRAFT_367109 [Lindgomyces ingoldianus]|uniref:Uncharacterized protein n=1 Tax=Lindgomyces ingoldianus TaxID=673940 RepID=A0ACB6QZ14_9PLEO|nr:uncharacterized protein BDR25DRAFT_367109 [Lindgomyces ingoldianus]KAF2472284.1 hypothetical protein BDR25DRAFT_367109 [Lindgomyces ingoldianus]